MAGDGPKFSLPGLRAGAMWMFGGSVTQAAIGFASNLVLVRYLTPADFGTFAIAAANIALVNSVLNLQFSDQIVRTKAADIDLGYIKLVSSYAATQIVLAGAISLALLWATIGLDINVILLWAGTLVSTPITVSVQIFEKGFDYRRISQFETSSHAISHILAAAFAIAGAGPIVLFARNLARLSVMAIWLNLIGAFRLTWPRFLTVAEVKALFARIQDIWVDGLFEQGTERIMVLLISAISGAHGAGFYYQAQRLASVPGQFINPVAWRMGYNYFANRVTESERTKKFVRFLQFLCAVMLVITAGLLIGVELFIEVLFGPSWTPVAGIVLAFGPFIACTTILQLFKANYFSTQKGLRFVLLARIPIAVIAVGIGSYCVYTGVNSEAVLAAALSAGFLSACLLAGVDMFVRRAVEKDRA